MNIREMGREELYREAFALIERANHLILSAREKHEAMTQKKAA